MTVSEINENFSFEFFDLYHVLSTPHKVEFDLLGRTYTCQSFYEENEEECTVQFDGKWFRTVDDFMEKAKIGDMYLAEISGKLYPLNIVKDEEM